MRPPDSKLLSPETDALLEVERSLVEPPPAARAAVRARLAASIAMLPAGPLGPTAAADPTPALATSGSLVKAALSSKVAIGAAMFALGTGAGVGLHSVATRSPSQAPETPRPVASLPLPATPPPVLEEPPPPSLPPPSLLKEEPATPAVSVPSPQRRKAPAAVEKRAAPRTEIGTDAELAEERALIEVARTALARRQAQTAILELERHALSQPHGRLVEEREALWVQALVALGRLDDAKAKAAQFKAKFPKSMLLPAVEASAASSP